jgi:hypothetical protein
MEYMVPWGLILMGVLTAWRALILCYQPTLIWDGDRYRTPSKEHQHEAQWQCVCEVSTSSKNALKANTMSWIIWGVCFGPFVLRWWVTELLK